MNMKRIFLTALLAVLCGLLLPTKAAAKVDGVTVKDHQLYALQGEKLKPLTENLELPCSVEVYTNKTFKVGKQGSPRQLKEGQEIRSDGWLLNPDGSIEPVYDHVTMKKGQVYLVRDGDATAIKKPYVFPNGMRVGPRGYGSKLPDGRTRMQDGQLFRLNGTPIQAMDTVTLKQNGVVVQKNGSLIHLSPIQIMGMSDGTRVHGNGLVVKPNGTTIYLQQGQTILVEGAKYTR